MGTGLSKELEKRSRLNDEALNTFGNSLARTAVLGTEERPLTASVATQRVGKVGRARSGSKTPGPQGRTSVPDLTIRAGCRRRVSWLRHPLLFTSQSLWHPQRHPSTARVLHPPIGRTTTCPTGAGNSSTASDGWGDLRSAQQRGDQDALLDMARAAQSPSRTEEHEPDPMNRTARLGAWYLWSRSNEPLPQTWQEMGNRSRTSPVFPHVL